MSSDLAPDGLALVQAFINSLDYPDGPDELGTPESAAAWLGSHGVDAGALQARDVKRLVEARETFRDFLEAHTGENVEPSVAVRLQEMLGSSPLFPVLSQDGASLTPARPNGVGGFFAALSAALVEANYKGTWSRLKVCRKDSCRFAFYDRSKNGCGCWCSMAVCGSREKARTYRARHKQTQSAESPT
jgi:predicted RNA-binding Zn ribbon-like protein